MNSKDQDRPGHPALKPLHAVMLQQARGREAAYALFLRGPKVASELGTLAALARLSCTVHQWSVLDKPTKRWLEGELCGRVRDEDPCSSGLLAVAIACWCGAASVRLAGISLTPGYHYLRREPPQTWWRGHVEADRRALAMLRARFGEVLAETVAA